MFEVIEENCSWKNNVFPIFSGNIVLFDICIHYIWSLIFRLSDWSNFDASNDNL